MSSAGDFYDPLETRDPGQRELALFHLLPDFLELVKENAPAWCAHLESVDPGEVTSREALARLPLMRKVDLKTLQARRPRSLCCRLPQGRPRP